MYEKRKSWILSSTPAPVARNTSQQQTAASIDAGLAFARYGDAKGPRTGGHPLALGTLTST
jgi:hypothetical protein